MTILVQAALLNEVKETKRIRKLTKASKREMEMAMKLVWVTCLYCINNDPQRDVMGMIDEMPFKRRFKI